MIIDGKYFELRTFSHSSGLPSKLWRIDYNHYISSSIIVEAETEDEAKRIGLVEARRNSGFNGGLCDWTVDFAIKRAVCIKDFAAEAPAQT